MMLPIVLVQNEETADDRYDYRADATGERYHFTNHYKNKVIPGTGFIYYRGTRRADGPRGTPEYFGFGTIGNVYLDPDTDESHTKSQWRWYCEIAEYLPFETPVPFMIDGRYFENIPQNQWSVAVRTISEDTFRKILGHAGVLNYFENASGQQELLAVQPVLASGPSLLKVAHGRAKRVPARSFAGSSKRSKIISEAGEQVVLTWLSSNLPDTQLKTLKDVGSKGNNPGWDFQYKSAGQLHVIEVKSSAAHAMTSVRLTVDEWQAAQQLGDRYSIYLVTRALSKTPEIEILSNPAAAIDSGELDISPSAYRIYRNTDEEE